VPELLGRGFCGGHVTLIFTVEDHDPEPINQGSRGIGICLEDGVEIICRGKEGVGRLDVSFTEHVGDPGLYEDALNLLSKEIPEIMDYDWEATVKLGLPTGQGFGMSAAGSVSFCSSIQRAIGIPYEEGRRRSLMIAHLVDRKRSSGLGDVTALSTGGVEIRKIPGSPFSGHLLNSGPGKSEGWSTETEIILAWKNEGSKHTSSYIDNPEWRALISEAGNRNLEGLSENRWSDSRWSEILDNSKRFSEESGLSSEESRADVLRKCEKAMIESGVDHSGVGLLCMLGTSVAIVPNNLELGLGRVDEFMHLLDSFGLNNILTRIGEI
tara:strand:+ start:2445 stop:3419 length:975 start_codon:yes stop_codon:yes gene_type:complete